MKDHFIMPEGYIDAKEDVGEDADLGPYRSYTFPCGSVMYTYYDKPGLVSFCLADTEEEQELQKWRVVVEQRNVFYEEAETAEEARRIALEDRTWDDDTGGKDTYDFEITVEEDGDEGSCT